jgi:hypothetical protein
MMTSACRPIASINAFSVKERLTAARESKTAPKAEAAA